MIVMLHPCFYTDRSIRANGSNDELASGYFTQRKVTQQLTSTALSLPATSFLLLVATKHS